MGPGPTSKQFQTLMAKAMRSRHDPDTGNDDAQAYFDFRRQALATELDALRHDGRSADDHYMALRLEPGAK